MATYSDDFNRSDSTNLGSNWSEDVGDWAISSNRATVTSSIEYGKLRWVGGSLDSNNYYVECSCASGNGLLYWTGPAARCSDNSNNTFYAFMIGAGYVPEMMYLNNGSWQVLGTGSTTIVASTDYTVRIEVEGSTIRGFINGNLEVELTHTGLSSGSPGVASYGGNSGAFADNWIASDLSVPTLRQSQYRFFYDNDVEGLATVRGDLNSPISLSPEERTRLRVQVDTQDIVGTRSFALQYRINRANQWSNWTTISVGDT